MADADTIIERLLEADDEDFSVKELSSVPPDICYLEPGQFNGQAQEDGSMLEQWNVIYTDPKEGKREIGTIWRYHDREAYPWRKGYWKYDAVGQDVGDGLASSKYHATRYVMDKQGLASKRTLHNWSFKELGEALDDDDAGLAKELTPSNPSEGDYVVWASRIMKVLVISMAGDKPRYMLSDPMGNHVNIIGSDKFLGATPEQAEWWERQWAKVKDMVQYRHQRERMESVDDEGLSKELMPDKHIAELKSSWDGDTTMYHLYVDGESVRNFWSSTDAIEYVLKHPDIQWKDGRMPEFSHRPKMGTPLWDIYFNSLPPGLKADALKYGKIEAANRAKWPVDPMEEALEDDPDLGASDPFEYLSQLGFYPKRDRLWHYTSWTKDIGEYPADHKIIVGVRSPTDINVHIFDATRELVEMKYNSFEEFMKGLPELMRMHGLSLGEALEDDFTWKDLVRTPANNPIRSLTTEKEFEIRVGNNVNWGKVSTVGQWYYQKAHWRFIIFMEGSLVELTSSNLFQNNPDEFRIRTRRRDGTEATILVEADEPVIEEYGPSPTGLKAIITAVDVLPSRRPKRYESLEDDDDFEVKEVVGVGDAEAKPDWLHGSQGTQGFRRESYQILKRGDVVGTISTYYDAPTGEKAPHPWENGAVWHWELEGNYQNTSIGGEWTGGYARGKEAAQAALLQALKANAKQWQDFWREQGHPPGRAGFEEALEDEEGAGEINVFQWLTSMGYTSYRNNRLWLKEVPGMSFLVSFEPDEIQVKVSNEAGYPLHVYVVTRKDAPDEVVALHAVLAKAANEYGRVLEAQEDDELVKDVSGDVHATLENEILNVERAIDELNAHGGDKDLTIPFTILLGWMHDPWKEKHAGWDWPMFLRTVVETWLPALKNAGMEIQADDLKRGIGTMTMFKSERLAEAVQPKRSDTLVIHMDDRSTDFLKIIYEGLGFDEITGRVGQDELIEAIEGHDRIFMLGHGAPSGLFGPGYLIGDEFGELLSTKVGVYIWCNADAYAARHKLTGLVSGMFISEVGEAAMFGIQATQQEVDASNHAFARVVRNYLDTGAEPATVRQCYTSTTCKITQFNSDRLYVFDQGKATPELHGSSAYHQELKWAKEREEWDKKRQEQPAPRQDWSHFTKADQWFHSLMRLVDKADMDVYALQDAGYDWERDFEEGLTPEQSFQRFMSDYTGQDWMGESVKKIVEAAVDDDDLTGSMVPEMLQANGFQMRKDGKWIRYVKERGDHFYAIHSADHSGPTRVWTADIYEESASGWKHLRRFQTLNPVELTDWLASIDLIRESQEDDFDVKEISSPTSDDQETVAREMEKWNPYTHHDYDHYYATFIIPVFTPNGRVSHAKTWTGWHRMRGFTYENRPTFEQESAAVMALFPDKLPGFYPGKLTRQGYRVGRPWSREFKRFYEG